MMSISKLHIVWQQACLTYVISRGVPFPDESLDDGDPIKLERLTRHAYRLGQSWLSHIPSLHQWIHFSASSGTAISEVRFIPCNPDWFITVSKGIWSMITCWSTSIAGSALKLADWSSQGAIISGIAINSNRSSKAMLAVSTNYSESVLRSGRSSRH